MKKMRLINNSWLFSALLFMISPAIASNNNLIAAGPSAAGSSVIMPQAVGSPYSNVPSYAYRQGGYYNASPYGNPYYQSYPYGSYPNYNPYAPTYLGRYNIGGVVQPVYGPPQVISNGWYGINIGGNPYTFWQAPSGFYYPWSSGFSYSDRPVLTMSPNGGSPMRTQPPVTTVLADMKSFLVKAKSEGKISSPVYADLEDRINFLQKKAHGMAESNEGVLDPDQEAELRKDVDKLGQEVAYRVHLY